MVLTAAVTETVSPRFSAVAVVMGPMLATVTPRSSSAAPGPSSSQRLSAVLLEVSGVPGVP